MTAIQLVFDNGIESPLFDTKKSEAGSEVSNVELTMKEDQQLSKILCRCSEDNAIVANLILEHTDGIQTTIFDKKCRNYGD